MAAVAHFRFDGSLRERLPQPPTLEEKRLVAAYCRSALEVGRAGGRGRHLELGRYLKICQEWSKWETVSHLGVRGVLNHLRSGRTSPGEKGR